jgi:hypothetical protein
MNERIKELAKEAAREMNETGTYSEPKFQEKFAELIVRECADVLLKWKGEPFPFDEDLAASLIKEHFGVGS